MKSYPALILGLMLAAWTAAPALHSNPPGWWDTYGVIDTNLTENNYGPVNLGQLKNAAIQAKRYLDAELTGGAGTGVNDIITLFYNHTTQTPIVDGGVDHYAPINLGQLKHIAKPFYDRLDDVGYDTVANLQARSGYGGGWTDIYAWDPGTSVAQNYAPVTIGQLKMVFSFDLAEFDPPGGGLNFEDWVTSYFGGGSGLGWDDEPDVTHETYGLTLGDAYMMNVNPTTETMGLLIYSVLEP